MIFNNIKKYNIIFKPQNYSYVELILFGLNFSFRRLSGRNLKFNLQYGDHFSAFFPDSVTARVFKRRVTLYGDNAKMKNWINVLSLLRYPNAHTGKGLRMRVSPYKVKPGKDRKK